MPRAGRRSLGNVIGKDTGRGGEWEGGGGGGG